MQKMTGRDSAPVARSNAPISIFAREDSKVTAKTKRTKQEQQEQPVEQAPSEEQAVADVAPVVPQVSQVVPESKEALLAIGLKRCSKHGQYLDRLPEAARQLTSGRADVSIRRVSEFGKSGSAKDGLQPMCKACDHVTMHDALVKAAGGTGTQTRERLAATLGRLTEQRDALNARIAQIQAQVDDLAAAEHADAPTEA